MYDLKLGQLVECEWLDPAVGAFWVAANDVTRCYTNFCVSVGFVHTFDDVGLVLTPSFAVDTDGDENLLLRQYLPWGCITRVWILREPEKSK